jgi:SAM-dependent methyltransferase
MSKPNDTYAQFARFYDREYARFDSDLDFYREFAVQANGPILELGCGTGRVLRALEDSGLPLTGIDSSPAMLAIARQRLNTSTRLVHCDMTEVSTHPDVAGRRYWMAFSAINTFLHLETEPEQRRTLVALRETVVEGGLLLLDLMVPDPGYLSELDGRLMLEFSWSDDVGNRLDKWVSRTHDLASQIITTTVFFDTLNTTAGHVERVVDRYVTRYIHRFELEHLLARCGWELVSLYGGYDLQPFDSDAERMIALATWHEPTTEGTPLAPA